MSKAKAQAQPSQIPGWDHENVFSKKTRKSKRTLRGWRRQGIGPAWAKFGVDIYYRDNAAQAYLETTEIKPVRSRSGSMRRALEARSA